MDADARSKKPDPGTGWRVRINYDSADELTRLHDVGPALAKRIVKARQDGPFRGPDDLIRVPGLGPALASALAPHIDWGVSPPMDAGPRSGGDSGLRSLTASAEMVFKITTALLGVLYVLGLLISNLQMMELGIADFAAFNTRNVMVGTLFVVYLSLLLLFLAACIASVWSVVDLMRGRRRALFSVLVSLFFGFIAFLVAAPIVGYLSLSGLPWSAEFSDGGDELGRLRTLYGQFSDAFFHPKVLVASAGLALWTCFMALDVDDGENGSDRTALRLVDVLNLWLSWDRSTAVLRVAGFLLLAGMVMVDYADEVYPNLRYNLGGGQPRVATLQVGTESAKRTVLAGFPTEEQTGVTGPVVIWHQSDRFLYVSSLFELPVDRAQMAGLALGDIRGIQYLPAYVRVSSGYRITSVEPAKDAAK
jgi:hypothetical protein